MPHLVKPIRNTRLDEALAQVRAAHLAIVKSAREQARARLAGGALSSWGADAKRLTVNLESVGKPVERFVEVLNMAATMERLIDALAWFTAHPEYERLTVQQCHPTTSDDKSKGGGEHGNDLVLVDDAERVRVRCEICDVVSGRGDSNNKEPKDLESLGCAGGVPADGVERFLVTSGEFAGWLVGPRRRWADKDYRYELIALPGTTTKLLRVVGARSS